MSGSFEVRVPGATLIEWVRRVVRLEAVVPETAREDTHALAAEIAMLLTRTDHRLVVCPVCLRVSRHPDDIAHGYCGACHAFVSVAGVAVAGLPPNLLEEATATAKAYQDVAAIAGAREWDRLTDDERTLRILIAHDWLDAARLVGLPR